ncbi:MAG: hypothetical protein AB9866_19755 [Syntrophobacteraceae bacterium]
MPPLAYVSHQTPERIRLKIPSRKGDSSYFRSLEGVCATTPGVRDAHSNPVTGSLLLILDPDSNLSLPDFAGKLDLGLEPVVRRTLEQEAANQIGRANDRVREFTGGGMNLNSIAFLGCVAAGIYQISVGNIAVPAWFVAFWYAMNLASGDQ